MASPPARDSTIPKNEPLVNAIQLSLRVKNKQGETATRQAEERNGSIGKSPDVPRVIHDLEMDLNRPLKHALGSVFNNGGKVVLTFPGTSYVQLKNVAEDIRGKFETVTPKRSIFSKVWSCICSGEQNSQFPDIDVEVLQILTMSTHYYISLIRETIQNAIGRDPDVYLVKLINAETENEVLTVDPYQGPHQGRVYFRHFIPNNHELDDASLFFRVEFEPLDLDQSHKTNIADGDDNNDDDNKDDIFRPVIIWINLNILLPIAKDEHDNSLHAFLPETNITPPSSMSTTNSNIPPNIANPFYWLPAVVQGSSYQSVYFFRQHGTDESAIIYPAVVPDPVVRISKGSNDAAVINASNMQFVVERIQIDGHTN